MSRFSQAVAAVVCAAALAGCGGNKNEESIPIKADPMAQVKTTLERYAAGQPLGSEVTSYDFMVTEVRKTDAAKADILKAGFDELQKTKGGQTAAKAKDLMKKLSL